MKRLSNFTEIQLNLRKHLVKSQRCQRFWCDLTKNLASFCSVSPCGVLRLPIFDHISRIIEWGAKAYYFATKYGNILDLFYKSRQNSYTKFQLDGPPDLLVAKMVLNWQSNGTHLKCNAYNKLFISLNTYHHFKVSIYFYGRKN